MIDRDRASDLSPDELDAQTAAELPDREAMSLLSTDPSAALAQYGDTSGFLGATDLPEAGEGNTVSDVNRVEHINSSETATAGPG
jgi:hypothetical protein